jgi:hypothetical protein
MVDQPLELPPKILCAFLSVIRQTGIADHFEVGWGIVDHHAVSEGHRLNQGRVGPADFRGLDKAIGIGRKLPVPFPEEVSGKQDIAHSSSSQVPDVLLRVWRVPDDYACEICRKAIEGLNQVMHAILRHKPANK